MAKAEDLGVEDVYAVLVDVLALDGDTSKGEFRMLCPVHEAGERGHKPSCDVNLETGYVNCWSCPFSGDLVDLGVVVLEKVPFEFRNAKKKSSKKQTWLQARGKVRSLLQPNDPDARKAAIHRRTKAARKLLQGEARTKDQFEPIIPPVDAYEFRFPRFLENRGFNEETLRRWQIRFVEDATLMKEDGKSFSIDMAVAIPIFDRSEELLGWCYRATEKSSEWFRNVRYIYTPGVTDRLAQNWFGMHLHQNETEVAIVEGALDAIWCDQNGIPAIAILGSQVKQTVKIRELMDFRKVTLLTDRDASGATTAHYLGEALLQRGVPCTVALWPRWMLNRKGEQAKDAQDLCGLDLELVHTRSIPYIIWRRGNRQLSAA